jgi:antitoxin PrlF
MATATVTSKGQITIPVDVRTELGLKAGDRVDFVRNARGNFELAPKNGSIERLKGMLKGRRPTISIEEINEAIAIRGSRLR